MYGKPPAPRTCDWCRLQDYPDQIHGVGHEAAALLRRQSLAQRPARYTIPELVDGLNSNSLDSRLLGDNIIFVRRMHTLSHSITNTLHDRTPKSLSLCRLTGHLPQRKLCRFASRYPPHKPSSLSIEFFFSNLLFQNPPRRIGFDKPSSLTPGLASSLRVIL